MTGSASSKKVVKPLSLRAVKSAKVPMLLAKPDDKTRQRADGLRPGQREGRQFNFGDTEHQRLFDLVRGLYDVEKRAHRNTGRLWMTSCALAAAMKMKAESDR